MEELGRTIFNNDTRRIVKLSEVDVFSVKDFCEECNKLGLQNNKSLERMKWDTATWFAALDESKIYSIAGYHKLNIDEHSYRVLFRGAQLPGYKPNTFSKDVYASVVHWTYLLEAQINDILKQDPQAKLYISTNIDKNNDAPSSHKLTSMMTPLLIKRKLLSLEYENIDLYFTKQNLYRVNVEEYFKQRSAYFDSK